MSKVQVAEQEVTLLFQRKYRKISVYETQCTKYFQNDSPRNELIQKKNDWGKNFCLDWPARKYNQTLLLCQLFSRNVQLSLNNTDSSAEQCLFLGMQPGTCNQGKLSRVPCGCECLSGTPERSVEASGSYLCQRWPTPYGNNRPLCVLSPLQWIILRNTVKEAIEQNVLMWNTSCFPAKPQKILYFEQKPSIKLLQDYSDKL